MRTRAGQRRHLRNDEPPMFNRPTTVCALRRYQNIVAVRGGRIRVIDLLSRRRFVTNRRQQGVGGEVNRIRRRTEERVNPTLPPSPAPPLSSKRCYYNNNVVVVVVVVLAHKYFQTPHENVSRVSEVTLFLMAIDTKQHLYVIRRSIIIVISYFPNRHRPCTVLFFTFGRAGNGLGPGRCGPSEWEENHVVCLI